MSSNLNKTDLTKTELKKFGDALWPAKAVTNVEELKELLDCCFYEYGEDDDDGGDGDGCGGGGEDEQWKNFSAYCRKVGGFAWINALHPFYQDSEEDDDYELLLDTPLTYILSSDPSEWRFVSFLLQMGADVNVRNGKGQPPLHVFVTSDCPMKRHRTFSLLMELNANSKAIYKGKTIIQYAYQWKDIDQVGGMVWEDIKRKNEMSDSDVRRFLGGQKKRRGKRKRDGDDSSDGGSSGGGVSASESSDSG